MKFIRLCEIWRGCELDFGCCKRSDAAEWQLTNVQSFERIPKMPQLWAGCRCSVVEISRNLALDQRISYEYHKDYFSLAPSGNHLSAVAVELVSLNY